MKSINHYFSLGIFALALGAMATLTGCQSTATLTGPVSSSQIDSDSRTALGDLLSNNRKARRAFSQSVAVLVFPQVRKAGLMVAVQRGFGALIQNGNTVGYYQTSGGSYGYQAGIQTYGYALFFTDPNALSYLRSGGGWDVGSAPSLVMGDSGWNGSLGTMKLKSGIYAFLFNPQGLMVGLGLQGSKITQVYPGP